MLSVAALLVSLSLGAVRAYPYPVAVTQPDGSTISVLLHGDESWSYRTDVDGNTLSLDAEGYYRIGGTPPAPPLERKRLFPDGGLLSSFVRTKSVLNYNTVVIPVQFSDLKFTHPDIRNEIDRLFNEWNYADSGATGSVHDWFRDNLGSFCNMSFHVCDAVTLPEGYAHYGANGGGVTDRNVRQLVAQACAAVHSAGLDFSRFDFNDDGYVDNVFIIFAGHNEAEGADENHLWPQSWNASDQQICYDGVKVSNFSLYSEYRGANGYQFAGIGTICHEYCHLIGLPDLYDVNGDTEGSSYGAGGTLSVMDLGNYNNEGRTPPYLTLFEKQMLGLVGENIIQHETSLTVGPLQDAGTVYQLPCDVRGEKYWLEYHDGEKWDEYSGGSGLVIYHIDKSDNASGSMSAGMRWQENAVNGCGAHPCAVPVTVTGDGVPDDGNFFFPGSDRVTDVHSSRTFALMSWDGKGIGLGLADIMPGSDGMEMKVIIDDAWDFPEITGYSVIPDQTSALLEWEASKQGPGTWVLVWGDRASAAATSVEVTGPESYRFTDLIPGDEYYCDISYSHLGVVGRTYGISFRTVESLNHFPLIGAAGVQYSAGDEIRLTVLNLTEEVSSVRWTVDGSVVKSDRFTFEKAGSYCLEVGISYLDGSFETLTKILKVK